MNQQIRELKQQAGIQDNPDQEGLDLFAELIVQDCIRTLRSNGYNDAAKCLQDIHFGIENPV